MVSEGTEQEDRANLARLKHTLPLEATYETLRHAICTVTLPRWDVSSS